MPCIESAETKFYEPKGFDILTWYVPAQKEGQQRTSKRSSDSPNISANGVGSMTVDTSSIDDGGTYLLHVQSGRQAKGSKMKPACALYI